MNHEHAIRNGAVERYVLGEMPSEERDAFEEHFFECEACADEMRLTTTFVETVKTVLTEATVPAPTPVWEESKAAGGWLAWLKPAFMLPAMAAACGFIVYQDIDIRKLKSFKLAPVPVVADARGESKHTFQAGEPFYWVLSFPDLTGSEVSAQIRSESGSLMETLSSPLPKGEEALTFSSPRLNLAPGKYTLSIAGRQIPFDVR